MRLHLPVKNGITLHTKAKKTPSSLLTKHANFPLDQLLSALSSLSQIKLDFSSCSRNELLSLISQFENIDDLRKKAVLELLSRETLSFDKGNLKEENTDSSANQQQSSSSLGSNNDSKDQFTCKLCEKYDTCDKPCELINNMLPGKLSGSHHLNKTLGDHIDYVYEDTSDKHSGGGLIRSSEMSPSEEQYYLYKNCPPGTFTDKQWQAVRLRFKDGLKHKEIADVMKIERSTASGHLVDSKKKMEKFYKDQHVKRHHDTT